MSRAPGGGGGGSGALALAAWDAGGGVSLYEYTPSESGPVLTLRGDAALGALVGAAAPARARLAAPPHAPPAARRRQLALFPTLDGGIAALVPVDESDARALSALGTVSERGGGRGADIRVAKRAVSR
jgi:hypothetical protein